MVLVMFAFVNWKSLKIMIAMVFSSWCKLIETVLVLFVRALNIDSLNKQTVGMENWI